MAECWTCGSEIDLSGNRYRGQRFFYKCPKCEGLEILKDLRLSAMKEYDQLRQGGNSAQLNSIEDFQRSSFDRLIGKLSGTMQDVQESLAVINSSIVWGMQDLLWQMQEQTAVLMYINETLRILATPPAQRQANEFRVIADELMRRGVPVQAEEYYLRALDLNPLDYSIYIGLAYVHISLNQAEKALAVLERSLPHAPRGAIDYKSYSYRLAGHVHASMGNYQTAQQILWLAIQLSPEYEAAYYDYAQYSIQADDKSACLSSAGILLRKRGSAYERRMRNNRHLAFIIQQQDEVYLAEVEKLRRKLSSTYQVYEDAKNQIGEIKKRKRHRELESRLDEMHGYLIKRLSEIDELEKDIPHPPEETVNKWSIRARIEMTQRAIDSETNSLKCLIAEIRETIRTQGWLKL